MNEENIPVRQWQELYQAGAFETDDPDTLERAGWGDIDAPLSSPHLHDLSQMVLEITHPLILDHYRVYFEEHSTRYDHKYGTAYFGLVSAPWRAQVFHVELNSPFQPGKWALFTRRYGRDEPEQIFDTMHELAQGIHTLADELEHGTEPLFVKEKRAVKQFLSRPDNQRPYTLRREGDHSYSYRVYGAKKTVHVAQCLEDVPIEFQNGGAILLDGMIDGMYVYCPEDIQRAAQKKKSRRPER